MPVPKHAGKSADYASPEFREVSLLTYEPCFDPDREEWFVDVALRTKSAAEPFVRFGLVRYQENAASDNIMVSEPVTVMMQLLPDRTLSITELVSQRRNAGLHRFKMQVHGPAGIGVKKLVPAEGEAPAATASLQDELDIPLMRARLFWEHTEGEISTRKPMAGFEDGIDLPYVGTGSGDLAGSSCWLMEIAFPAETLLRMGAGKLIAYVEEIERRMPATYPDEPITVGQMREAKSCVDSGPRFSARIPFFSN